MSDNQAANKPTHDVDSLPPLVSAESVADYLTEHPDFLIKHPELLTHIQVFLQNDGVVSLTQIQSEQYRDKIKQLKSQLETLVQTARTNEHLYKTYALLNISIANTDSYESLQLALETHLLDGLNLEAVKIVLLEEKAEICDTQLSEIQKHAIFDKKLARSPFYLGRLGKLESQALFPNHQAKSAVLIRLENESVLGLLAVCSKDPMHFNPDMDTMLLDFLRLSLNQHIPKLQSTQ